jgi:uncharacterized phage protein gp47/JayE
VAELTSTGLVTRTQAEILAEIEADQRAEISEGLDQSTSSPLGQVNLLFARAIRLVEEAIEATYASIDPDGATADALERVSAITGTVREAATASRVEVVCDLDAGTYAAGTLRAAPAGRPEDTFINAAEVTSAGGNTDVVFEAEETGPILVAADTLAIASPVTGWNSIVSHPAATPGEDVETDEALRRRRVLEIERPGSSSATGIAADLSANIPEIESVTVVENDTDATADSVPPHAIEVIVYGPSPATTEDDETVAAQILASKAAGIGTYGTTSVSVVDSQGQTKIVKFTRPADVACTCALVLVTDSSYVGDAEVAAHVAERAAETLVPGLDLSWDAIVSWVRELSGILRVTSVSVNGTPFGTTTITTRQIATLAEGDVSVTSATGTP